MAYALVGFAWRWMRLDMARNPQWTISSVLLWAITTFAIISVVYAEDMTLPNDSADAKTLYQEIASQISATRTLGSFTVVVSFGKAVAMPDGHHDEWLELMPTGAGAAAYATFIPDPRMILGSIILIPGAAIGYSHEKGIWETVHTRLTGFNFVEKLADDLIEKLDRVLASHEAPRGVVELRIRALGLVGDTRDRLCMILKCDLDLIAGDSYANHFKIEISDSRSQKDEPPPQCAKIEKFAEDNARLVVDSLREYSAVTAAITANHIQKGIAR